MKLVVVPLWKPLRFFPCRKCVTIFEVFSSLQFQKMDMKVELLSWRVFISESHDSLYLAGGFKSFLIFYRGNSSILTDIVQKCWNHLPVHHLKWWMLVSNEGKKILASYAIRWAPMVLINGGTRGPYGIINRSARNAHCRWRTCRGREGNLTQLGVLMIFVWNFGSLFVFHHVLSTQISKHIKTQNIAQVDIFQNSPRKRMIHRIVVWASGL